MKIACSVGRLGAALDFIAGAVPVRTPIEIVGHCKLVIADGELTVTATDLDIALTAELDAADSEPGSTTTPCARLKRLVAELPASAEVILTADGDRLRIACGRGRWALPTLPVEDFPVLTAPGEDAATFTIPEAEVRRMVQRVGFAISEEETRYYLNGIYLYAAREQLCAVATNGHRLSETLVAIDPGAMPGVILPLKAVAALDQLGGDVTARVTAQRVELTAGDRRVVTKLIDGTFPNYTKVLPAVSDNSVSVDAAPFLSAVRRLDAILETKARERAVGLQWADGTFSVCLAREDDAGTEELDPISCLGSGHVAAQAHYLIEQLEALDAVTVSIDHAGGGTAIRITRLDEPATTTVLMPLDWNRPAAVAAEPAPARKRARSRR